VAVWSGSSWKGEGVSPSDFLLPVRGMEWGGRLSFSWLFFAGGSGEAGCEGREWGEER